MSISESSRRQVEERASCRCEYCQMPDILIYAPMEIDHIRPKVDGGVDDVSNLALACPACNNAKHAQLTAIDPTSSDVVALYNPRQEDWLDHFKIAVDGYIFGTTPTGCATVLALKFNEPRRVQFRQLMIRFGKYPPADFLTDNPTHE